MSADYHIPKQIINMISSLSKPALLTSGDTIVFANAAAKTAMINCTSSFEEVLPKSDFLSYINQNESSCVESKITVSEGEKTYTLIILKQLRTILPFPGADYEKAILTLSHDFRMPLSLILTAADILLKKVGNDPKLKQYTDTITQNSYKILRLSNNLIDYARQNLSKIVLQPALINLTDIANEIYGEIADFCRQTGINFVLEAEKGVSAYCDALHIERAILNLISNALKFTDPGGEIRLRFYQTDSSAVISVSDTGAGMDKETLDHIFEPFFSLSKSDEPVPGCGLGLYIVKSIVEAHKATISVDSEKGKGSTFTITLPVGDGQVLPTLKSHAAYKDSPWHIKVELSDVIYNKPAAPLG